MHAVRKDPELKRFYRRKLIQKGMGKARIAAARKLGIRLWIMMRDQIDYEEFCRRGKLRQKGEAHAGMPDFNVSNGMDAPGQSGIECARVESARPTTTNEGSVQNDRA